MTICLHVQDIRRVRNNRPSNASHMWSVCLNNGSVRKDKFECSEKIYPLKKSALFRNSIVNFSSRLILTPH